MPATNEDNSSIASVNHTAINHDLLSNEIWSSVCKPLYVCIPTCTHVYETLTLITCWLDTDQGYFSRLYFNIFNRYLKQNTWIVKWSMLLGFFSLPMKTANIYVNIFNQHFSCLYLYRFKSFNNSSALPHNNTDIKDCFHWSVVTYADICEHISLINYHLRVFSRLRLKCCLNCPLCLYCSLRFFSGLFWLDFFFNLWSVWFLLKHSNNESIGGVACFCQVCVLYGTSVDRYED